MKKKTEHSSLLDDLRNEDSKKRLHSVQCLKEIATAIGPVRTRTEFLQYLTEFIDDEQQIVLELLNQLSDFSEVLGGQEYEKAMLPLLMAFCRTDEKKEAEKATEIIESILLKNKDLILEVVKKLAKTEMTISKEAATRLISSLIDLVPQNEAQLVEIFSSMIFSNISVYRIIGAKYLNGLLEKVKNKEEIGKFIEMIFNETDDLPKIWALEALMRYYAVNSNIVLSKFKALLVINNWRINMKFCENIHIASKTFSKVHFKSTFESSLIKFLDSPEPELRAKACGTLNCLAANMTEEEIRRTLIPLIKKLSTDPMDYVKVELSENIVSLVEVCDGAFLFDEILPIIFSFIKNNELAVGIMKNFEALTKKFNPETLENKILTPLINQFSTENWKNKCKLIELLGNIVSNEMLLNEKLLLTLINLLSDRISAVREKATLLMINVINQHSSEWSDAKIMAKLSNLKNSQNYHDRQALLEIIEKTSDKVSEKTLKEFYKPVILIGLVDKVTNVRFKALSTLKESKRLSDKIIEKYIEKLRTDEDSEVKELALAIVKA